MFENFSYAAMNLINDGQNKALQMRSPYIGPEHLLLAILENSEIVAHKILIALGVNTSELHGVLEKSMVKEVSSEQSTLPFSPSLENVLKQSNYTSALMNSEKVGTEHVLLAMLDDGAGLARQILYSQGLTEDIVRGGILARVSAAKSSFARGETHQQDDLSEEEREPEQPTAFSGNFDTPDIKKNLSDLPPPNTQTPSSEKNTNFGWGAENEKSSAIKNMFKGKDAKKGTASSELPTLSAFATNLTARASSGNVDPVMGRDKETQRVLQVLSRRTKNNPILLGPPGVGKTAVVEGLAQAIIEERVPKQIAGKEVYALDLPALIAGSRYRGDFEERITELIKEIQSQNNIILFIDEIHGLVGAGSDDGAMDAANIMKPMLARGELQTIGATTLDEYRKYFEKDPALERRFQPISVDEPSTPVAIDILKAVREKYEQYHEVSITDGAVSAAVTLSSRYITDRYLPDKALDLIDEAASRLSISRHEPPVEYQNIENRIRQINIEKRTALQHQDLKKMEELKAEEMSLREQKQTILEQSNLGNTENAYIVDENAIAEILSEWTGIPVQKMTEEETTRLLHMEKEIQEKVIGQKQAVASLAKSIRRTRAGLSDPKKPSGSFIFVGPSGVGKTELAKALADFMFGDREELITLDMSEYMEKHSVSRLIGSPPGYVGHEEGGQLTEAVRRKPFSVVLFDEIEKAHPDVFNLFLQILDEGRLTDSHGQIVDFRNTVIIMTSNLGSSHATQKEIFAEDVNETTIEANYDKLKEKTHEALKGHFRPEFLNRVNDIIVFHPLTIDNVKSILEILLVELGDKLAMQDMKIVLDAEAKDFIAHKGYDPSLGARPLKRALQNLVEEPLSEQILWKNFSPGDTIFITQTKNANDGGEAELKFSKEQQQQDQIFSPELHKNMPPSGEENQKLPARNNKKTPQ